MQSIFNIVGIEPRKGSGKHRFSRGGRPAWAGRIGKTDGFPGVKYPTDGTK